MRLAISIYLSIYLSKSLHIYHLYILTHIFSVGYSGWLVGWLDFTACQPLGHFMTKTFLSA